jgi:hypothetical protein
MPYRFLIAFLFISFSSYSQSSKEQITPAGRLSKLPVHKMKHLVFDNFSLSLPFSKFIVFDLRYDTSKLGYYKEGNHLVKLVPNLPSDTFWHKSLKPCLQFSSNSDIELHIVLKHLWIKSTDLSEETNNKLKLDTDETNRAINKVIAHIELFAFSANAYTPLLKLDTIMLLVKTKTEQPEALLALPIKVALEKFAQTSVDKKQPTAKKLDLSAFTSYQSKRFKKPVLTAETLKKGIYHSFAQFVDNRPDEQEFWISSDALTDELYVKAGAVQKMLDDLWGYSDGEKGYIKLGYNFFELVKAGNTFELWGSSGATIRNLGLSRPSGHSLGSFAHSSLVGPHLKSKRTTLNVFRPLQLNMDTGTEY